MKTRSLGLLSPFLLLASGTGHGESKSANPAPSALSVPISINLAALEEELNERVPQHLETIDQPGEVCVEAEWLKTKGLPNCHFKGIKLYCEDTWIKTKVTPDITCDVSGWVKRDGKITLTGSGAELTLTVPLKAKVTAQGRGEIGKNITQTVEAATVISAALAPEITPDWQPTMKIDTDFRWTRRPQFKLFNLIPVTVGSKAEPELRKQLAELEKNIPSFLANAKLKDRMGVAWTQIQKPMALDEDQHIWARFAPSAVGFSGIDTAANVLKSSFHLTGFPQVTIGKRPEVGDPSPLPALTKIEPVAPRFAVVLPITVELAELQSLAQKQLHELNPIQLKNYGYEYDLQISKVTINPKGNSLEVSVDFTLDNNKGFWNRVDILGLLDVKGRVNFTAVPIVDAANNIVRLSELRFDSFTNSMLADSLVDVARLPPIRELIRKSISYNVSGQVRNLRLLMGKELNRQISEQVRLNGRIDDLSVGQPQITASTVRVPVLLQGAADVLVGM